MPSNSSNIEFNKADHEMTGWYRSSRCATGVCVEVFRGDKFTEIRDSKDLVDNPDADFASIKVTNECWAGFLLEVLGCESPGRNGAISFARNGQGGVSVFSRETVLAYDSAEWFAFELGVRDGEFGPVYAGV